MQVSWISSCRKRGDRAGASVLGAVCCFKMACLPTFNNVARTRSRIVQEFEVLELKPSTLPCVLDVACIRWKPVHPLPNFL